MTTPTTKPEPTAIHRTVANFATVAIPAPKPRPDATPERRGGCDWRGL